MYHIGSEKGKAISRFLRSGVESWRKKKKRSVGDCKKVRVLVCIVFLLCFK